MLCQLIHGFKIPCNLVTGWSGESATSITHNSGHRTSALGTRLKKSITGKADGQQIHHQYLTDTRPVVHRYIVNTLPMPSRMTVSQSVDWHQIKRKIFSSTCPLNKHYIKFNIPKPKSSCPKSLQARNSKTIGHLMFCFWLKPKIEFVKTNEMTMESHGEVKRNI